MSFRLKTIVGLILIQGSFLALLFFVSMSILQKATDNAISKRAYTASTLFASLAKDSILSFDLATLETYVDELLRHPEINYVRIRGRHGTILASGGHETMLAKPFSRDNEIRDVDDGIFDAFSEIKVGAKVFGRVEMGLDIDFASDVEASARKTFVTISIVVVFITAGFSFFLGQYLTRKISALVLASKAFSGGDLDYRLMVTGQDELGQAAMAFNDMANKLKTLYHDLEEEVSINNAMFSTSPSGIITIDTTWQVERFNLAAEELFGYKASEVIGHTIKTLIPLDTTDQHDGFIQNHPNRGWTSMIGIGREVEAQRKDGSRFPIHLAVGRMEISGKHMFVGIITDITDRKKAEEDLQKKHRAVEESPVGVFITDTEGIINYVNPASLRIHGYDNGNELKGQEPRIFKSGNTPPEIYQAMWRHLKAGKAWTGELLNKRKDGSLVWVRQHLCPIRQEDGHIYHYVSIQEDVTERRQYRDNLEDTVRKRTEELEHARDAAEAGARTKAAFLANMSHEIRTPMNAVIGFAEVVLQDKMLSKQTSQHVRTIFSSARALLGIINDILDVSKLESGKFVLETVCFHLPNALADTMRTVEHRAVEKNLAIKINHDGRLPLRFVGDPTRVRQVILNLVGNAIKFTQKGGITLAVQPGEKPDMLHFTVTDTGIGMTPKQTAKVFEPFSQADEATTRRFGGTGLGTTISKQIVELMGGKIWVESESGRGSTFHFTAYLPKAVKIDGCLFEEDGTTVEAYRSPRLFRILLAEDIEANATLAKLRLDQQGHTIHWVKNGREAVEESQTNPYDLILMDVMMPELDGLDATREIRKIEKRTGAHMPVLALTAGVMREDHDNCHAAGMDGVEAKPIDFNQLFATMELIVPKGAGKPNTNQPMVDLKVQTDLDFSPLSGVVDYEKAIKTWRVPDVYAKALMAFADERLKDASEMERLLIENPDDTGPAQGVAHALKGVAGNLAMGQVAHWATEIDADLKSGQRKVAKTKFGKLNQSLQEAVAAIANLTLSTDGSGTPTKTFDAETIRVQMMALLSALDELNPDAIEPVLVRLAEYVDKADLAAIQRGVDGFDFDKAKAETLVLAEKLGLNRSPVA